MDLKFDANGLIPVILQDTHTGQVLMMAWMNTQAFELTQQTRQAHFWSRSRAELWRKGATSGSLMHVDEMRVDCDADVLLLKVTPDGPACHTGETTCFYRPLEDHHDPK